jgi:hypothetical protein
VAYRSQIDPATTLIEAKAGFVGGVGLPVLVGWAFGGVLAAIVAYIIGRSASGSGLIISPSPPSAFPRSSARSSRTWTG